MIAIERTKRCPDLDDDPLSSWGPSIGVINTPTHYTDFLSGYKRKLDINVLDAFISETSKKNQEKFYDIIHWIPQDESFEYDTLTLGEHTYVIPSALFNIAKEIKDSKYIHNLQSCWDDERAEQIEYLIWVNASIFLIEHALYLYEHLNCILVVPEINPVSDGSIDLSWRTKAGRMLINIKKSDDQEMLAFFYGDKYNNRYPFKGCVPTNETATHLIGWMKENLID